jgi:glutaredoxin
MKTIVKICITGWFLALLLTIGSSTVAFAETAVPLPEDAISATTIEVFVRHGCPHCAKAELFLETIKQEQPTLKIIIRDVIQEPAAMERLQQLAKNQQTGTVRVPAFYVGGELIVGYSDEITTGQLIRNALTLAQAKPQTQAKKIQDSSGSCEAEASLPCGTETATAAPIKPEQTFAVNFLGYRVSLEQIGLPLFTLILGLLDGFNPCSMWVLILMISLLASMKNRLRMFAIAGTFIAVEGIAYFIFMAAWLNLFLLIGLSRISEIIIAIIALLAGIINLKDIRIYGRVISLSIPDAAKPGIYTRIRGILQAQNLTGALIGAVVLAILVQIVEFMCTSGFPALYTRILTLQHLSNLGYYGYLLLYNVAYMFDDLVVLAIGVITLSQRRLQEKEGRLLKLIGGLVMIGLGVYLIIYPVFN